MAKRYGVMKAPSVRNMGTFWAGPFMVSAYAMNRSMTTRAPGPSFLIIEKQQGQWDQQ